MDTTELSDAEQLLLLMVPEDGKAIGNKALQKQFGIAAILQDTPVDVDQFDFLKQALLDKGLLVKGRERGGSVKRAEPDKGDFDLESEVVQAELTEQPQPKKKKAIRRKKASVKSTIISYRHTDKRKNNPEVGMVNESTDPDDGKDRWCYDPHIDPALQFDFRRAQVEKLIDDALESGDQAAMRTALEELKRYSDPYLNWAGKAERTSFDVDTVSLHVHERIDPASILAAVRNKQKEGSAGAHQQPDLFAAPFENLPLRDAIDFYKHEKGWSNRLIAGDSLQVMNSLLQKEGMAGQVQMIYIDPPYGIKYGSNFQPFVNKRDVKDRRDDDLTLNN